MHTAFCLCFDNPGQLQLNPLTPNIKEQIIFLYSILSPYFSYKSIGEKLLRYQENSPWVIISLIIILMTSGVE